MNKGDVMQKVFVRDFNPRRGDLAYGLEGHRKYWIEQMLNYQFSRPISADQAVEFYPLVIDSLNTGVCDLQRELNKKKANDFNEGQDGLESYLARRERWILERKGMLDDKKSNMMRRERRAHQRNKLFQTPIATGEAEEREMLQLEITFLNYMSEQHRRRFGAGKPPYTASAEQLARYGTGNMSTDTRIFSKEGRMSSNDVRKLYQRQWKMVRTQCKLGVNFAKLINAKIHFILDGFNEAGIVGTFLKLPYHHPSQGLIQSCTSVELRYIFRKWDTLYNTTYFYHNGLECPPPWEWGICSPRTLGSPSPAIRDAVKNYASHLQINHGKFWYDPISGVSIYKPTSEFARNLRRAYGS